jgi:hypothetical protein
MSVDLATIMALLQNQDPATLATIQEKLAASTTTPHHIAETGDDKHLPLKRGRGRPKKVYTPEQLAEKEADEKLKAELKESRLEKKMIHEAEKAERQVSRENRQKQRAEDEALQAQDKEQKRKLREEKRAAKLQEEAEQKEEGFARKLEIYLRKKVELEEYVEKYGPFE